MKDGTPCFTMRPLASIKNLFLLSVCRGHQTTSFHWRLPQLNLNHPDGLPAVTNSHSFVFMLQTCVNYNDMLRDKCKDEFSVQTQFMCGIKIYYLTSNIEVRVRRSDNGGLIVVNVSQDVRMRRWGFSHPSPPNILPVVMSVWNTAAIQMNGTDTLLVSLMRNPAVGCYSWSVSNNSPKTYLMWELYGNFEFVFMLHLCIICWMQ